MFFVLNSVAKVIKILTPLFQVLSSMFNDQRSKINDQSTKIIMLKQKGPKVTLSIAYCLLPIA
jgi:hypothetical protein